MDKPRVIITRRWPHEVERELAAHFDVVLNAEDMPMSRPELVRAMGECDALCPTVSDRIDAEVLGVTPRRVRIVASYGVGFNHIDVDAARAADLVVTNTPEVLTDCTADLAMTLLLAVARRAGEGERELRSGQWSGWRPTHLLGTRVSGKTLGLVGFGRIAKAVAQRAHGGFGMRILFHDPQPQAAEVINALGATACDSVEALLEQSDFVSLHCPASAATYHLIDAERIARMPAHAFLVNTARGDVVDQLALAAALREGRLAGAGLDVYEGEPAVPAELIALDNVVLLPHLGSASRETRIAMGRRVLENLRAYFDGRAPRDRVA
ncbi:MAG: D-glycerate dehydrogenase [Gammaproteobacteria bacterium]